MLSDIDIRPADAQPLGVGLGEEYLHLLYQEYRDDVTGVERAGLMYTHGSHTSSSWSFQYSVGDDASHLVMEVLVDDGEDRLISSWIEGQGKTSNGSLPTPTLSGQAVNHNACWLREPRASTLTFERRASIFSTMKSTSTDPFIVSVL